MTSMIDRVARAICIADGKEPEDWMANERLRTMYRTSARAAIEAMREPTDAMRNRYNDPDIVGYGPDGSDHDKVWGAGVDAALFGNFAYVFRRELTPEEQAEKLAILGPPPSK